MSNNKLPPGWGKRENKPAKWIKHNNDMEDSGISEIPHSGTNACTSVNNAVEKLPVVTGDIVTPPVVAMSDIERPVIEQADSSNVKRQPAYTDNDFQKSLDELAYLNEANKQSANEKNISQVNRLQRDDIQRIVPQRNITQRNRTQGSRTRRLPKKRTRSKAPLIMVMGLFVVAIGVLLFFLLRDNISDELALEPSAPELSQEPAISEAIEEPLAEEIAEPIEAIPTEPIEERNPIIGNTLGNLANGGLAATDGYWVFFFGGDGLYRKRMDGSDVQRLTDDDWVMHINIVDDWIYFVAHGERLTHLTSRMKKDGSERQILHDGDSYHVNVVGEWIYFFNPHSNSLSMMRTDGSELQELCYGWRHSILVANDWIYFIGEAGGILERMRIDGRSRETLVESEVFFFNVVDDLIYYVSHSYSGEGIYRLNIYSEEVQKLHNEIVLSINVVGDWIFYICHNNFIYRKMIDGTNNERLSSTIAFHNINVVGDWIIFNGHHHSIHRMRTDGSMEEPIYEVDFRGESENYNNATANATIESISIIGTWVYVTTTFGDDATSQPIYEFTIIPPIISIYDNNTLFAIFWESSIEASLIPLSRYEFLITEQVASGEGERWYPDDEVLKYIAESELLRWTHFNPFSNEYVHHFFVRR